jgi:hypothetical protein
MVAFCPALPTATFSSKPVSITHQPEELAVIEVYHMIVTTNNYVTRTARRMDGNEGK